MKTPDRETALVCAKVLQSSRCGYGTVEGDGGRCDCKYINTSSPYKSSEQTGCCEARTIIQYLNSQKDSKSEPKEIKYKHIMVLVFTKFVLTPIYSHEAYGLYSFRFPHTLMQIRSYVEMLKGEDDTHIWVVESTSGKELFRI